MTRTAALLLLGIVACTSGAAPTRLNRTLEPRPSLPGTNAETKIVYGAGPGSAGQTLDLYHPARGKGPFPLVLRFNGDVGRASTAAIIEAGFAIAFIPTRAPAEAPLVTSARDVKAAVRYLRANAARHDIDPDRFIAWGSEDGGWFAVMLGVTGDQATVFDGAAAPRARDGAARTSSAVQVVIDWGGPTDFATLDADQKEHSSPACTQTYERHGHAGSHEAIWLCGDKTASLEDASCAPAVREANLAAYVPTATKFPAFYFAHGGDDCVISIWQSVRVLEALKKREQTPGFHRISRAGHEDSRFEVEETARSLAFIQETFHPEAGAKPE